MDNHEKLNIVCFSNQLWEYPLWTNKKHVMSRMSALGHNVIFVDPPLTTGRVFLKYFLRGAWSLKRLWSGQYVDGSTRVFTPLNPLPFFEFLSKIHARRIQRLAEKYFDPDRKTVLWIYHVELAGLKNYITTISHDKLVYDCVDNYIAFPKYDTPEKKLALEKQEAYLAGISDIVFTTAPGLFDKMKKYNSNTYFTPNVGDYEKFSRVPQLKDDLPADLAGISRPRIGFAGAVDEYKFDKKLVRKIAEDYPNYSFVILGPLALKDTKATSADLGFDDLENVHFLGVRAYQTLERYYAGFDVYIIPYQLNDYTVGGCFPVKFHDALAGGLPVVVTNLPAYQPFSDVCYISRNYNEFSQNIRKALEEDTPALQKERRLVAKENSWDGKVSKMLDLLLG